MALGTPTVVASATPIVNVNVTTSSFTPTPGALLIAMSVDTGSATSNVQGTINSSHPGTGTLTWAPIGVTGGGNTTGAVRAWWAIAPASPTDGTVTINCAVTPTIHDAAVYQVTGADTTTPIFGAASATGTTATSISGTLSAAPTAADMTFALAVNRNKTSAPTVGSGYTSLDSFAKATPSASYLAQYRTGSTSTAVSAGNVGTAWSGLRAFNIKAASGVPPAQGSASGTWTRVGAASGARAAAGSAAGTWARTGAAVGARAAAGVAAGLVTWAGTATGVAPARGSAAGSWSHVGTAVGSSPARGASAGAWGYAGAASGLRASLGAATGVWTRDGAAVGGRASLGSAAGAWTRSGSAIGSAPTHGSAAGSWSRAGAAAGAAGASGTAAGSWARTGAAEGFAPAVGGASGFAAGTWSWAGSASGATDPAGLAAGGWVWTGSAAGAAAAEGSAAGTWSRTGSAQGEAPGVPEAQGSAAGAWVWTGAAVGTSQTARNVVVLGFDEHVRLVLFAEHQRTVRFDEHQRVVTYAHTEENPMQLNPWGRELYDPRPATAPAVGDWEATFDEGATWHEATLVEGHPTWLLAGPRVEVGDAVAVITGRTQPILRSVSNPELIARRAPEVTLYD